MVLRKTSPDRVQPGGVTVTENEAIQSSFGGYWFWRATILAMTAFWGSNFAVIRYFASDTDAHIDPSVFATVRFGMAALSLAPFLGLGSREALTSGLKVGLLISIGYIGQAIGLESTTAEKAAFICAMQVVFVVFFSSLQQRRVNLQGLAAAGLGLMGVALLELTGATAPTVGDAWCLAMPASFGLSYVLVEKYAKGFKGMDEVTFSGAQCGGFALGMLPWLFMEQANEGQLPTLLNSLMHLDSHQAAHLLGLDGVGPEFWAAAAYTGVITTSLAIIVQTYAFKKVPSTDASVIIVSEPLWAALFAAMLLGEQLGIKDLFGGAFITAACIVNSLKFGDDSDGNE